MSPILAPTGSLTELITCHRQEEKDTKEKGSGAAMWGACDDEKGCQGPTNEGRLCGQAAGQLEKDKKTNEPQAL